MISLSTDNAATMSSLLNGVAGKILLDIPKLIFFGDKAHHLNLSIN